jgi:hypothetical protein
MRFKRPRSNTKATAIILAMPVLLVVTVTATSLLFTQIAYAAAVSLCAQYQEEAVKGRGVNYRLQNNNYAGQAECMSNSSDGANFTIASSSATNVVGEPPAAYPEIYRGCHWGTCTANSGLPLRVSHLGHPTTSWSTVQSAPGVWDAAYDIWYNTTPTTTGQPDGTEMMIWLGDQGAPRFPPGAPVVTIDGAKYYVRATLRSDDGVSWHLLIYKRVVHTTSVSQLELSDFTQNAIARGQVQPTWYLISVEAGFEIWNGGVGLATTSFSFTP